MQKAYNSCLSFVVIGLAIDMSSHMCILQKKAYQQFLVFWKIYIVSKDTINSQHENTQNSYTEVPVVCFNNLVLQGCACV